MGVFWEGYSSSDEWADWGTAHREAWHTLNSVSSSSGHLGAQWSIWALRYRSSLFKWGAHLALWIGIMGTGSFKHISLFSAPVTRRHGSWAMPLLELQTSVCFHSLKSSNNDTDIEEVQTCIHNMPEVCPNGRTRTLLVLLVTVALMRPGGICIIPLGSCHSLRYGRSRAGWGASSKDSKVCRTWTCSLLQAFV